MDEFVRQPVDKRKRVFLEGERRIGLAPRSLEKDLWVCWTLRELFGLPEWGAQLTFKGGTSLSKAWKLIERFSEDVDVVIERSFLGFGEERLGQKRLARLKEACQTRIRESQLPALRKRVEERLGTGEPWSLELAGPKDDPDQQTILFRYPTVFDDPTMYVVPVVRIEFGARAESEPSEQPSVRPFLAEAFPDLLGDSSFSLRTLAARRTFCEKAMLLHEETYRPLGKKRKERLSRHYYDLWCLIRKGVGRQVIEDSGLFERVAAHRQLFYRYGWMDYSTLRRGSLRVVPLPDQLGNWQRDYEAMRVEMFTSEPPKWAEILPVVQSFEREFNGT